MQRYAHVIFASLTKPAPWPRACVSTSCRRQQRCWYMQTCVGECGWGRPHAATVRAPPPLSRQHSLLTVHPWARARPAGGHPSATHGRSRTCAHVALAIVPPRPQFSVLHGALPGQGSARTTAGAEDCVVGAPITQPPPAAGQRAAPTALLRGPFLGAALAGSTSAAPTMATSATSRRDGIFLAAHERLPVTVLWSLIEMLAPRAPEGDSSGG